MVVCNCKYCEREIEVPEGIVFEGSLKDAVKHIEHLTDEKSKQCVCQSIKIGDLVKMKCADGEYRDFEVIDIEVCPEATYVTGMTIDGEGFWCNILKEIMFEANK